MKDISEFTKGVCPIMSGPTTNYKAAEVGYIECLEDKCKAWHREERYCILIYGWRP